jgi:hypothetical protein
MSKKAKSDTERRRWFNIFLNLSDLIKIEIKDDPNPTNPVKASAVELPSIDDEAAKMLKRIKNGGDHAQLPDSSTISS